MVKMVKMFAMHACSEINMQDMLNSLIKLKEEFGPPPPKYEIWTMTSMPEVDIENQPVILIADTSIVNIDTVTDADFVISMHPATLKKMASEEWLNPQRIPITGIPVFNHIRLQEALKIKSDQSN